MSKKLVVSNGPKRPPTPYIKYCTEIRGLHQELLGKPVSEQGKALGELWSKLDNEKKIAYQEEYKIAKQKYDIAFNEYKLTDEYKKEFEEKQAAKKRKNERVKRGKISKSGEITETKKERKSKAKKVVDEAEETTED
ncbi:hypothetical protein COBT_001024 [Conglomerata obtusa]